MSNHILNLECRSSVDSPHKGQWHGAKMFSLICAWTNTWANNRDAGGLRRYRVHYDVTVMELNIKMESSHIKSLIEFIHVIVTITSSHSIRVHNITTYDIWWSIFLLLITETFTICWLFITKSLLSFGESYSVIIAGMSLLKSLRHYRNIPVNVVITGKSAVTGIILII